MGSYHCSTKLDNYYNREEYRIGLYIEIKILDLFFNDKGY